MLENQSFKTSRSQLVLFYDNSRTKSGAQSFADKASHVLRLVCFDWYYEALGPDALHVKLKHALFKYPSSAASYSVPRKLRRQRHTRIQLQTTPVEDTR